MVTETLHYESAHQAQLLFANDDRNLKHLENELGVRAVSRDGWIKLEGEAEKVHSAKELFLTLEKALKGGSPIRVREFNQSLEVIKQHGTGALKTLYDERIQTSSRKPPIHPKTAGQKKYIEAIRKHDVTFGIGPASAARHLAMAMAAQALRLDRSIVSYSPDPLSKLGSRFSSRGSLREARSLFATLQDALHDMLPPEEIEKYRDRGIIEIAPLAYMRGRTLNYAFIVLDEAQNATTEQMFMFLTRLGMNSRAVITGDPTQIDLPKHRPSGLLEAKKALQGIEDISIVEFERKDVIRHRLVQKIVAAYETHRQKQEA